MTKTDTTAKCLIDCGCEGKDPGHAPDKSGDTPMTPNGDIPRSNRTVTREVPHDRAQGGVPMTVWKMLRWFDRGWWAYLFDDLRHNCPGASIEWEVGRFYVYRQFPWPKLFGDESAFERIVCRVKGHPEGEVFYGHGDEPDHHCRTCGEDLG